MVITIDTSKGKIDVEVQKKKIKNMHLRVYSDKRAVLSCPISMKEANIRSFLGSKVAWIERRIDRINQGIDAPISQISQGDYIQLFGMAYRIVKKSGKKSGVEIKEKEVIVTCLDVCDEEKVKKAIDKWWRNLATVSMEALVDKWLITTNLLEKPRPTVKIRKMKSMWGNYNSKTNTVTFNEYLIKATLKSIEYVVLHELAHIVSASHDDEFYAFIRKFMPDYKIRRKELSRSYLKVD